MLAEWLRYLEALEAISQDADTRRLFLHLAALSEEGRLHATLSELALGDLVDAETKGTLDVIGGDESFVLVVQEYLRRTQVLH
jgi:hypothetical protein